MQIWLWDSTCAAYKKTFIITYDPSKHYTVCTRTKRSRSKGQPPHSCLYTFWPFDFWQLAPVLLLILQYAEGPSWTREYNILPQIRDKCHPHQQGTFIKNKKAPGLTSFVILKLKIHLNWIWLQIKTHSWSWDLTNILLGESPKSSFISNVLIYFYYYFYK